MGMHVWQGCDEVRADLPATSVTVGVFDGVHRGHRLLLDRVVADREQGLLPVAVTFDPHPLAVLRPELAPSLLTTMAHRLELFADAGLGGVLIVPFTGDLAAESAERFATRVLAETLRARHVVVGCNFRFGHRAAGDVGLLAELGRELGFQATVVDLAPLDRTGAGAAGGSPGESGARAGDGAGSVSSTAIRAMVAAGDVEGAAHALGRAHRVSGEVAAGDRRGRDLGYPTANVAVPMGTAVPADGVYVGRMRTSSDGAWRPAAVSVGTNPTFDGEERRVEAHVLDVPEGYDVYGEHADVEFVARLRPMVRFDSPDALRAQMAADVARARALLGV
jgi:riboflavin kinase/FMN adenylyltransferase